MNKYDRQRSKEIKDIIRTDQFGKMDYKQARRKWKNGVRAFPVGDSGQWLAFDCSKFNFSRKQLQEVGQAYYMIARYAAERHLETNWEFYPFADGYVLYIRGRTYTGQRFGFQHVLSTYHLQQCRGPLAGLANYIIRKLDRELHRQGFYPPKLDESDYILDPSWMILPDGSVRLYEVSLIPNPRKGR